jgi:hypothetical protein
LVKSGQQVVTVCVLIRMPLCADLEGYSPKLVNIYRSDECFEQMLQREMKRILFRIRFFRKSYGFRELKGANSRNCYIMLYFLTELSPS